MLKLIIIRLSGKLYVKMRIKKEEFFIAFIQVFIATKQHVCSKLDSLLRKHF